MASFLMAIRVRKERRLSKFEPSEKYVSFWSETGSWIQHPVSEIQQTRFFSLVFSFQKFFIWEPPDDQKCLKLDCN